MFDSTYTYKFGKYGHIALLEIEPYSIDELLNVTIEIKNLTSDEVQQLLNYLTCHGSYEIKDVTDAKLESGL